MTDEYTYIKGIYDLAMQARSKKEQELAANIEKEMNDNFWQYVGVRIQKLVEAVFKMRQSGKYTESQLNEAETRVSSMLTMVQMYTMPEVIDKLIMNLVKEKQVAKLEFV